jgi:hypothetical protein
MVSLHILVRLVFDRHKYVFVLIVAAGWFGEMNEKVPFCCWQHLYFQIATARRVQFHNSIRQLTIVWYLVVHLAVDAR